MVEETAGIESLPDLDGLRVLVTRPGDSGTALCAWVERAGGRAVLFPALEIAGIAGSEPLRRLASAFPNPLLSIFISPNAATFGKAWLDASSHWETVTANRVAAVGEGTARRLRDFGIAEVLCPQQGVGAAALLALPELAAVAGTEVVVFRGVGGKEALAVELGRRGARVRYAEVYRRERPATPLPATLLAEVDVVTTTSREALENLFALADGESNALLRELPMLVSSEEAAQAALAHGQQISPIISPQLSNRRIVEVLARWRTNQTRAALRKPTS